MSVMIGGVRIGSMRWISVYLTLMLSLPAAQNVLLITVDDMNLDASAFGYSAVSTPNLERLAGRGVNFTKAYCQYPSCGPSRASFMTGLRPDTLQVWANRTPMRRHLSEVVTLGQHFKQNGYFTARVGKIFHYANPTDIGTDGSDDLESWDERYNPVGIDHTQKDQITVYPKKKQNLGKSMSWWDPVSDDAEHTDGKVSQKTIELLKANKDKPFFIACGFFNPHCPYVAPRKYFDLHPLESIELQSLDEAQAELADVPPMALSRDKVWPYATAQLTREQARKCKQAYYACISFLDTLVGQLLDALEREGLMENTTIVFLSDHGYFIGEKGLWYKNKAFERAAQVPLIISTPESRSRESGQECEHPVELIDLFPTLVELTETLDAPAELEGRSLVALIEDVSSDWPHVAYTQVNSSKGTGGYSVRDHRYRYTEWDQGSKGKELYDHKEDPTETVNLAHDPQYQEICRDLSQKLKRVYEK